MKITLEIAIYVAIVFILGIQNLYCQEKTRIVVLPWEEIKKVTDDKFQIKIGGVEIQEASGNEKILESLINSLSKKEVLDVYDRNKIDEVTREKLLTCIKDGKYDKIGLLPTPVDYLVIGKIVSFSAQVPPISMWIFPSKVTIKVSAQIRMIRIRDGKISLSETCEGSAFKFIKMASIFDIVSAYDKKVVRSIFDDAIACAAGRGSGLISEYFDYRNLCEQQIFFDDFEDGEPNDWEILPDSKICDSIAKGKHSLMVYDGGGSIYGAVGKKFPRTERGILEFCIYPTRGPSGISIVLAEGENPRFSMHIFPEGGLKYCASSALFKDLANTTCLSLYKWNNLKIKWDVKDDYCEVFVDGVSRGNLSHYKAGGAIDRIKLQSAFLAGTGDRAYIDDVSVKTY